MPGEPGPAPPPSGVEAWPSVAPFGEASRISVSIIVLAFLCSSAGSTFASPGGQNHTWPPTAQTTGLDQVSDPGIAARLSEPHPLRPHFARSSSAGHRWSAARDTSWPTRITSSGRHINAQICAAGAERSIDAATEQNGGYRMSNVAQRKLQCATRGRWTFAPDRRLGARLC
jgi:hypothetical protein